MFISQQYNIRVRALLKKILPMAAVIAVAPAAHAQLLWDYSYSGSGVSGNGYMTTTGTPIGGAYTITGVSGTRDAQPVESLLAPGTYLASGGGVLISDNLLYTGSPYLGYGGFTVASGSDLYNVYNVGGQYYDLAGADCGSSNCGQPGHMGTTVSFSVNSLPEFLWQFSYSGAGVSGSGYLTTLTTPVGGAYQIVGLSGLRNGDLMNALLPAGTYLAGGGGVLISDNLLFPVDPFLAYGGFTFHAGSDRYNVYFDGSQYYELAGADCGASNCGQPGHMGTPISFTVSRVPEPGTVALLGVGLAVIAWQRRRTAS